MKHQFPFIRHLTLLSALIEKTHCENKTLRFICQPTKTCGVHRRCSPCAKIIKFTRVRPNDKYCQQFVPIPNCIYYTWTCNTRLWTIYDVHIVHLPVTPIYNKYNMIGITKLYIFSLVEETHAEKNESISTHVNRVNRVNRFLRRFLLKIMNVDKKNIRASALVPPNTTNIRSIRYILVMCPLT